MPKDLSISLLLDYYGNMLTEKQREVIDFYYNDDLSLSEIAENEGISRQGVRDAIKRAEAQLTEMEDRLGFLKRSAQVRAGLEQICEAASRIRENNSRCSSVRQIGEDAGSILQCARRLLEE